MQWARIQIAADTASEPEEREKESERDGGGWGAETEKVKCVEKYEERETEPLN